MGFGAEPRKFLILRNLRGWMWPFGCWMKNRLIPTTRVFDRLQQSTPYLSVVLWSYSEKYSGQVRYLSQFCSQLSEQIHRFEQIPFSRLDSKVFASTDKRWKGKLLGLTCATDAESKYIWATTIEWATLTFKMAAMWKQKDRWIQETKKFQQNYRKLRNDRWQPH